MYPAEVLSGPFAHVQSAPPRGGLGVCSDPTAGVSCPYSLSLVRLAQPRDGVARETIGNQCDHTYKPASYL